jgi:nitrate reductase cytochrome c-type subunit
MKGFNKAGDILKIPLGINDFCSYCPYNKCSSCHWKSNSSQNETCKISISQRTITLL